MNDVPRIYERLRAGDRVLPAWEEDHPHPMTEEEWRALSEERRREIVLMFERLRNKRVWS